MRNGKITNILLVVITVLLVISNVNLCSTAKQIETIKMEPRVDVTDTVSEQQEATDDLNDTVSEQQEAIDDLQKEVSELRAFKEGMEEATSDIVSKYLADKTQNNK